MFPEGVGKFDYSFSSYNEIILIAIVANLSLIASSFIREKFIFNYSNEINKKKITLINLVNNYNNNKKKLIYFYFF